MIWQRVFHAYQVALFVGGMLAAYGGNFRHPLLMVIAGFALLAFGSAITTYFGIAALTMIERGAKRWRRLVIGARARRALPR